MSDPYNPLSKLNLARSIEGKILETELTSLESLPAFRGAGIYALYYAGDLDIYAPLKASVTDPNAKPIYVGKAIPEGGRVGGFRDTDITTSALSKRLRKHASSINAAVNLELRDFLVRYLVVDDVWIPLGENMLIETYQPVWNKVIAGFGNNPLGSGRDKQKPSLWDILHPGRIANVDPRTASISQEALRERVHSFFSGLAVPQVSGTSDEDS